MLKARIYKGIEFIRISDLNADQQKAIRAWASDDTIIKIQQDNVLLSDCVQFKDYCFWIENVYTEVNIAIEAPRKTSGQKIKSVGLALE
ncbi:MAG TPA: hypothetical protein PKL31_17130 [Fulvivirga sp.]|nr:hypothetical protein [Fulvivirga sp.]